MTGAILEYARGLAVVKSFGRDIPLEHFDIAFDHVSFGYDDRQVLRDVSFTIPEKTSTAIVGRPAPARPPSALLSSVLRISSEK